MRKIDTEEQDALIREVNEELKNEELKKFWDKYGLYVIVLVVAALTAAVSFETIKSWYIKRMQIWSDTYAYAVSMAADKKYEDSIESLDYIIAKDYGIFVELAKMQKINIFIEQNKIDEATKLMEEIIADKDFDARLKETVIFKLVSYKMENAPMEEILALIGDIADNEESGYQAAANEMIAITYLRDKNVDKAKEIYNRLLSSDKAPEQMKARIKDILATL